MDGAWSADSSPVVGVVDPEDAASDAIGIGEALETAVVDAGGTISSGVLEDVLAADPSVLVTAGERTLSAIARAGVDSPVLPIGPVSGIESIDRDRLPDALAAVLDGDSIRRSHPVLDVVLESTRDGEPATIVGRERALFDVTLITDEPARISEYGVRSRGEPVATFRADGVVVATPAGSHGYASAVDTPQLSPAIDAVAVAPIGPFVTQTRRWVLPNDESTFTVEREEGDVTLVVDGRSTGMVTPESRVVVAADGTLSTLCVPDERLS
ncbi:NAD(+)/NADH kinase [Natrinema longum]|uniref:NAD(+)/NADH kinase n=1 Tax=Natrinema longum TaxID=370324 RepID=A0A8A2UBL6_9EURY|nr:NAD(+)/NADH kinase [Natrinema longum]MBZ6496194.1 NAD(+)/NADH kinase [Natrinema longum]QSW85882.1 NAD(+)/NADH kinase [Natrinema longum]